MAFSAIPHVALLGDACCSILIFFAFQAGHLGGFYLLLKLMTYNVTGTVMIVMCRIRPLLPL